MKRLLKILLSLVGIIVVLAACLVVYVQLSWDNRDSRSVPELTASHDPATIARGEYIFKYTWQCWGCHAAGGASPAAAPSGGQKFDLANVGPGFGVYYSRNITPDSATGIGAWTDGEIVQAIREGVNRDRRMLFPIMPVEWLHRISDEDALSIVAYLRTVAPVKNAVPPDAPSFIARALFTFKMVSPPPVITGRIALPEKAVSKEYGEYAATALAGCSDCHTPRNLQNGKFYMDSLFAGGSIAFGEPENAPLVCYAPDLRARLSTGPGQWTEEQFVSVVRGGMRPDGTVASPQMPYARYKFLDTVDLRAMYAYLSSLPLIAKTVPPPRYAERVLHATGAERGMYLFEARCQDCHGKRGTGTPTTAVRLTEVAASLSDADLHNFVGAGQASLRMPSFAKTLSSDELNDVIAFIRTWQTEADTHR